MAGKPPARWGEKHLGGLYWPVLPVHERRSLCTSLKVTGLTVCHVSIPQVPSPIVAHVGAFPYMRVFALQSEHCTQVALSAAGGELPLRPHERPAAAATTEGFLMMCECSDRKLAPGPGVDRHDAACADTKHRPKEINDDAIRADDQVISSVDTITDVGQASEGIAAIGRIPAEEA